MLTNGVEVSCNLYTLYFEANVGSGGPGSDRSLAMLAEATYGPNRTTAYFRGVR